MFNEGITKAFRRKTMYLTRNIRRYKAEQIILSFTEQFFKGLHASESSFVHLYTSAHKGRDVEKFYKTVYRYS